jgi:V8-like Glu-specific endopeptidase
MGHSQAYSLSYGMKECVVQLLMYDRDTQEIFDAGSGTLISDIGHILTAAHVVMDPRTMALFHGRQHCTVLVAKYVADDKPPVVTWRASICSTDNALKQVVARSSDPSKKDLKDLAVLRLNGNVTCSQPPMVPGVQPVGFIAHEEDDIITGLHYLPANATTAPASGDAVRVFGYPVDAGTPGSMQLVCADTIITTLADGFIKTDTTLAGGFSGGPMVNSTGEVVGVMSKDRNTRHNKDQAVNVSYFRQLSGQIDEEHWMPTDADLQHPQLQVCQPDKLHQVEQGLAAMMGGARVEALDAGAQGE